MRVCAYVGAWVRGCVGARVYSHFANLSKIVQDAPRAGATGSRSKGTQAPERPPQQEHKRPLQEEHKRPPEPERKSK